MRGIVSGIKRLAVHDGDGLRTTVFLKGCPLRCIWCHNPEALSFDRQIAFFEHQCIGCGSCSEACKYGAVLENGTDNAGCKLCSECAEACPTGARCVYGIEYGSAELVKKLLEDRAFFENGNGGVTLSGGECLMQIDFVEEVSKMLHKEGVSVDIDTCGYVKRESFDKIIPYVDTFLYDVKAIDREVHIACTGKSNELILDNLKYLSQKGCKIEIRYPPVMGYNDGECEKIAAFLSKNSGITRVKVLQYHAFAASRYLALGMKNTLPQTVTTKKDVENAVKMLCSYGLMAISGLED